MPDAGKSGETVNDVQHCMDNKKLSQEDLSEVKGERLAEMTQCLLEDEICEHLIERLIDVLVPQIREQCVGIVNVIVQKCLKQHTGDQVGDMPVAQRWGGCRPRDHASESASRSSGEENV